MMTERLDAMNHHMILREENDCLLLEYAGQAVFRFAKKQPFLWAGTGKAAFKMRRGSFRFKDRILRKIPLYASLRENRITFADKSGKALLIAEVMAGNPLSLRFAAINGASFNRLWLRLPAGADEAVYGCGETYAKLNLRGERVRIWVQEHQHVSFFVKKVLSEKLFGPKYDKTPVFAKEMSYVRQPTFFSGRRYFVHAQTDAYAAFDFTQRGYHELLFHELPALHIGAAADFEALCALRASLLGTQPPLPDWVYDGAILGIQGSTENVERKLAAARAAGMPVCGVWCQDWQGARITPVGHQLMWNWEWDPAQYPGLPEKIAAWRAQGVRFLGYINPFLAVEKALYAEAAAKGYCVKNKKGGDYLVKSTTFSSAMVDFTNPAAYAWIKNVIKKNMIAFGLGGWMADFGEYLPTDSVLCDGDPRLLHNLWPAIWAKINREAVEECGKLGEVFFFTRAACAPSVRHTTLMWNGDQCCDWSLAGGMPEAIPAALSLGVSGYGLCHSDVGGFSAFFHVRRSPELMARWAELCALSPVMRSHEGVRPDSNAQFDHNPALLALYTRMAKLHTALKPYLLEAQRQYSKNGVPVTRPLFFYYGAPRDKTECYEYLLGRDILVAPVLEPGVSRREVYLPEDRWVHLWSGGEYGGGLHEIAAPPGQPPVFCRKSAAYLGEFLGLAGML